MATQPLRNRFRTNRFATAVPTYSDSGNVVLQPAAAPETPAAPVAPTGSGPAVSPIKSIFANDGTGGSAGDGNGGFGNSGGGFGGGSPGVSNGPNSAYTGPSAPTDNSRETGLLGGLMAGLGSFAVTGNPVVGAKVGQYAYEYGRDKSRESYLEDLGKWSEDYENNTFGGDRNSERGGIGGGTNNGSKDGGFSGARGGPETLESLGAKADQNELAALGPNPNADVNVDVNPETLESVNPSSPDPTGDPAGDPSGGPSGPADQNSFNDGSMSSAMGGGDNNGGNSSTGGQGDGTGDSDFAVGGRIVGPGGPTSDQVPINASNGEYMLSDAQLSTLAQELFGMPDPEMMRDYLDKFSMEKAGQVPNNPGGHDGFQDGSMQHEMPEMLAGYEGMEDEFEGEAPGTEGGSVSALRSISASAPISQSPEGMHVLDEQQQQIARAMATSASPEELSILSKSLNPDVLKVLGKIYGKQVEYLLQPAANVGQNMLSLNRPMITDTADRIGGISGAMPPIGNSAIHGIAAR